MAILNATPDSFSGNGVAGDVERAVAIARRAEAEGADIIDIGGESTRPGAEPVAADEELSRVIPVIEAVAGAVSIPISIDTSKAVVAEAALRAGARLVNDVRGGTGDPDLLSVAAEWGVPLVITHDLEPSPDGDLIGQIAGELERRVEAAAQRGVQGDQIIVDPGFGFGKTWRQNLEMLRRLREFSALGKPLLVGLSRKRTVSQVLGVEADDRLEGTLATTALAVAGGADMVRVHDVLPNVRVARMADAVVRGSMGKPDHG
jgi:dihydropteroate synthase